MDELWIPLVNLAGVFGFMLLDALSSNGEEQERHAAALARERRESGEPRTELDRMLRRQIP